MCYMILKKVYQWTREIECWTVDHDDKCQPLEKICSEEQYTKKKDTFLCLNLSIVIFKKRKVAGEINK